MKRMSFRVGLGVALLGMVLGLGRVVVGHQPPPQPIPPPLPVLPEDPPPTPESPTAEEALPSQLPAPASSKVAPEPEAVGSDPVIPVQPDSLASLNLGEGKSTSRVVPAVSLEWIGPPVARLGMGVGYQLVIRNMSSAPVHDLGVRARLPESVQIKESNPKAEMDGRMLFWQVGTLEPRQEKRIALFLIPGSSGPLVCQAAVTFTGVSTLHLRVHEPRLEVKINAPQQVVLGDPAKITARVTNPGDATIQDVKLRAILSAGLDHLRGKEVEFTLRDIPPHESRDILILCTTRKAGLQSCQVVARSARGLTAEEKATVDVKTARVVLNVDAPRMRYLGRHAVISIEVANTGTATAQGVSITDQVPRGFKVVRASSGGGHDYVTRTVSWYVGSLEPSESREVQLQLLAVAPGDHKQVVKVTATRGLHAEGEASTRVEGLSALLLEMVDLDDPLEVGAETSYEVRVTNTGTKTETNVRLGCTIPAEMAFLGARGPGGLRFKVVDNEIHFDSLPALAPRADAIYHIQVRATKASDVRFKARIESDGLSTPVTKQERTLVYGDEINTSQK
jgi:uncharacterized repeat protein (TIGR01451 family)